MKKILIIVPFLIYLSLEGLAQIEDLKLGTVRRKEHVLTETIYSYKPTKDSLLYSYTNYDSLGNALEIKTYNDNGKLAFRYLLIRDSKGYLIKQFGINSNGDTAMSFQYKNDNNGNQIEYYQIDKSGTPVVTQKRAYNSLGLNTLVLNKKADGTFYTSYRIEYDEKGRPIKEERFNAESELTGTTHDIYDSNNKLIRVDWEDDEGRVPSVEYTYNSKGECLERKYYRVERKLENGKLVKKPWLLIEKFSYYSNGLLFEYIKYRNDTLTMHEKHFYNR